MKTKTESGATCCRRSCTGIHFHPEIILYLFFIVCTFSCEKGTDLPGNRDDIPATYDLRKFNTVTPVRNQNGLRPDGSSDMGAPVGLCWAFASLAGIESNMLKQGITSNPLDPNASLSPWYLGNYIGFNDPCYAFNSATIPGLLPPTTFGYFFPSCGWGGGGSHWVGDYLIAGKEIPTWNECPMPEAEMSAQRTLSQPVAHQKKKYSISKMPFFFADNFASPADYIKHIKKYIMNHGAIQSFVHLEAIDLPGMTSQVVHGSTYNGSRFMDKVNYNMLTYEAENHGTDFLTHAIAIVGWDDHRKINVGGHTAEGAWLIKDSQGESSWDNGYFWVAYDDIAVNVFAAGLIVGKEADHAHQSKYQTHPGMLSMLTENNLCDEENSIVLGLYSYLLNGDRTSTSWGVAEFPLHNNETLTAVGIFCSNMNQKVRVHVFKNNLSGTPLITQDFVLDDMGYHILKLNHDQNFFTNETMLIAVGFENDPSHERLPLCYVQNNNHDFVYPTYFGKKEEGVFQLTPYADMNPNSAFFLQAIVRK